MIHRFDEVTSTQDILKELYRDGSAAEGDAVLAESQTSGRGRYGRHFHSPQGSGIYVSALLPYRDAEHLTVRAAAAVLRVLEETAGVKACVEWVNDVLIDGRKVAGILAEAVTDCNGKPDAVVLGVGLNVAEPEGGYPEGIRHRAAALLSSEKRQALPDDEFAAFKARLTDALLQHLTAIADPSHAAEDLALYRERLVNPEDVPENTPGLSTAPGAPAFASPDR